MKRIILFASLFATLVAQAQTFRIESSFADQVQALVIDSKAPVRLVCTAPKGQNSLALSTSEPECQFNPVAAVQDSLLTIAYPHAEGSIRLCLSHLPALITLRPGSTLVVDSLDNYTAFSHHSGHLFRVEERAELRMMPHFAPATLYLDVLPHGRILFPQGLDGGLSFNLMDSSYFEAAPEYSHIDRTLFLYEGTGRQGTPIEKCKRLHKPSDNSDVGQRWWDLSMKRPLPADNQLQLRWNAGIVAGLNSRAAGLSPYALGMGLMGEVSAVWYANWDRRYYDGFNDRGQSLHCRHRTWVGVSFGIEFLPFANQVVRTDGGDLSFTDNPTAVPSVPNYGPGMRPMFGNTYLSIPLQYAFTNDRRSGFTVSLRPGLNLNSFLGAWKTNGFGFQGMAGEGSGLSVVNPYRLDATFTFALRGVRCLPTVRLGLLPTFTTPEGRGVRTVTLTWGL